VREYQDFYDVLRVLHSMTIRSMKSSERLQVFHKVVQCPGRDGGAAGWNNFSFPMLRKQSNPLVRSALQFRLASQMLPLHEQLLPHGLCRRAVGMPYETEEKFMKALGMVLLLVGMGAVLSAQDRRVPEIDGASAGSAAALLSGAVLVFKSRGRK
jgi:hypothetical protein